MALGVQLGTITHHKVEYYSISLTSPTKALVLINYLDNHPLFTYKHLNFLDYKTCVNIMVKNEHLSVEGRTKAKALQSGPEPSSHGTT